MSHCPRSDERLSSLYTTFAMASSVNFGNDHIFSLQHFREGVFRKRGKLRGNVDNVGTGLVDDPPVEFGCCCAEVACCSGICNKYMLCKLRRFQVMSDE